MNRKVLDLLEKSTTINDISFIYWLYKKEVVFASGRRFIKAYLFNRELSNKRIDLITFRHNGKEYLSSDFNVVSEFKDPTIVGVAIEIPADDFTDDLEIIKEVVEGKAFNESDKKVVYIKEKAPRDNEYLKEHISEYRLHHEVFPKISDKYWQCSCGAIHAFDEEDCVCGLDKNTAKKIIDFDIEESIIKEYISKPMVYDDLNKPFEKYVSVYKNNFYIKYGYNSERMISYVDLKAEEEKYNALKTEADNKRNAAKSRLKKVSLIVCSFVAAVALVYASINYIIPYSKYFLASNDLKNGNFERAIKRFSSANIGDSDERAYEVKKAWADNLKENHEYDQALELYLDIYKNNTIEENADNYKNTLLDYALFLYENGSLKEAYNLINNEKNFKLNTPNNETFTKIAYDYALQLLENKNYKEALDILSGIKKNYKNKKELVSENSYIYSGILYDEGKIEEAYSYIYKAGIDSTDELFLKVVYAQGKQLLENGEYKKAVSVLVNIPSSYLDTYSLINDAKYQYVDHHRIYEDDTTHEYLKDLTAIGYLDSTSIFNELYKWQFAVRINNWNHNVRWCQKTEVEVLAKGGEPGTAKDVRIQIIYPNGQIEYYGNKIHSMIANSGIREFSWDNGCMKESYAGELTVRVLDLAGNELASHSIKVTY